MPTRPILETRSPPDLDSRPTSALGTGSVEGRVVVYGPSGRILIPSLGDGGILGALWPIVHDYMYRHDVPNLSLAIADDEGRILHCHGYTYEEAFRGGDPVSYTTPWTIFRLASVSKLWTSIALLQLRDADPASRSLDLSVQEVLSDYFPIRNGTLYDPDGEWAGQLTVRHLLQHQGGWIRQETQLKPLPLYGDNYKETILALWGGVFDYVNSIITRTDEKETSLFDQEDIFIGLTTGDWTIKRYYSMLDSPFMRPTFPLSMDFLRDVAGEHPTWGQVLPPGMLGAYSNWGFLLAGKVLERWSGIPYPWYLQQFIAEPVGALTLGFGDEQNLLPGEIDYYPKDPGYSESPCDQLESCVEGMPERCIRMARSVLTEVTGPDDAACVRAGYGDQVLNGRYGSSGAVACALDLILVLRDLAALDGSLLLPKASITEISSSSRTRAPLHGTHYGLGVDEVGPHLLKTGRKPGTRTLVYIHNHKVTTALPGGPTDPLTRYSLAILTNGDPNSSSDDKDAWPGIEDLKDAVVNALTALTHGATPPWDGHDLEARLLSNWPAARGPRLSTGRRTR